LRLLSTLSLQTFLNQSTMIYISLYVLTAYNFGPLYSVSSLKVLTVEFSTRGMTDIKKFFLEKNMCKLISFNLIIFFLAACAPHRDVRNYLSFDDRIAVNLEEYPYSAIGVLLNVRGGHGTGLLVHSRMVLTAAHVGETLARGDDF